jgi:polyisoprenoid-binding protein YceI
MKKRFSLLLALGLCLAGLAGSGTAVAQTFRTAGDAEQFVRFFADHTLGEVDGTLRPVAGALTFDPAAPTDGFDGHFTVDMTSFDTNLGMRDRDMRQNYLETHVYPEAAFALTDAQPTLLDGAPGDTLRLAITGSMTLHGVTRDHIVEATLVPTPDGYHVQATFPLLLSDYNIKPPRRFMMQVKDEIRVEIALNLIRQP